MTADPTPDLREQAVEAAHREACRVLIDNLTVSEERWTFTAGATPASVIRAVMSEAGPIIERAVLDRAEQALRERADEYANASRIVQSKGAPERYRARSQVWSAAADLVASLRDGG